MMMQFDARAVANEFLDLAEAKGGLTVLQLVKLVYFAQGWHLALYNEPLITENIQAWKFGPVVRSVYSEFNGFGSNPIVGQRARDFDWKTEELKEFKLEDALDPLELLFIDSQDADKSLAVARNLIRKVFDVYGKFSGGQMIELTHRDGTPWSITTDNGRSIGSGKIIDKEVIKNHFKSLTKGANG